MYRTREITLIKGYHTSSFRSQMGIIVDTIIKIGYAIRFLYGSKKTTHSKILVLGYFLIFSTHFRAFTKASIHGETSSSLRLPG